MVSLQATSHNCSWKLMTNVIQGKVTISVSPVIKSHGLMLGSDCFSIITNFIRSFPGRGMYKQHFLQDLCGFSLHSCFVQLHSVSIFLLSSVMLFRPGCGQLKVFLGLVGCSLRSSAVCIRLLPSLCGLQTLCLSGLFSVLTV